MRRRLHQLTTLGWATWMATAALIDYLRRRR